MKKNGFLNPDINHALSTLGHGDTLMVTDVGFPTPADDRRIDISIAKNLPELREILLLLRDEIYIERIIVAKEMASNNPELYKWIKENFLGIELELVPHNPGINGVANSAKWIIRTGALDPWGNIGLVCGVNWKGILERPGVKIPDEVIKNQND